MLYLSLIGIVSFKARPNYSSTNMKNRIIILLWLLSFTALAKPLPIEYFAKQSQFKSIKLSPDGKYFAATVPKEKKTILVVIDRAKMKSVSNLAFGDNEHVSTFFWANNERLVFSKNYQRSSQEKKTSKGEIYAANFDGSNMVQLFGTTFKRHKKSTRRSDKLMGKVIHSIPTDDHHILVRAKRLGSDYDNPIKIYKVNIYDRKREFITETPFGNMSLVIDAQGQPFIASGKNRAGKAHKYFFIDEKWQKINDENDLSKYSFLSLNKDATKLYLTRSVKGHTKGLYQYDIESKAISLLFNHPIVDIAGYIREPVSNTIIGVKTILAGVEYHYIDKQNSFSKLHQQLVATFPKHEITLTANSLNDKEMVVKIKSDQNPGEYYLFDQYKRTINFLISAKPWLKPELMMPRAAISFNARDGQKIHGYLTLPELTTADTPLIVDVHGGPFGVYDSWLFNTDAQMLANNGFAVLQINFRGSGGFGKKFKESAYLKRSTLIQHDIIDGTRWALALDNISDNKVCIIGGSFGGYSALMAPLIEPALYKCAIPRYGPYDLVYQMTHADYISKDSVSVGAMEKYGDNEEIWQQQSPITYIDKLKTPLFIVTGGKDTRVPPQSALNLKAALDKRNIAYQWLYKEKEGHGFINPENKIELYQKSLAFLNQHLGD